MENQDVLALMQAISESKTEMVKAIGELAVHVAGSIEPLKVRVAAVEHEVDKQDRRQWVHSLVVFGSSSLTRLLTSRLHWPF